MILRSILRRKGFLYMSSEKVKSQVQFELQQIDKLLYMYDELLIKCREKNLT